MWKVLSLPEGSRPKKISSAMRAFFGTDLGLKILFPLVYCAAVFPVVALVFLEFWSYAVAFLLYATVLYVLYTINIIVPGIALTITTVYPRYNWMREWLGSIYPLAFFLGTPMLLSAAFQSGIANDSTRDIDPRIHAFPLASLAMVLLFEIAFAFVWLRRARSKERARSSRRVRPGT